MKKTVPILTMSMLLAGCGMPLDVSSLSGLSASSSGAATLSGVPVHGPARFQLADFENRDALIVQLKAGRSPKDWPGLVRDKALDGTGRYRLRTDRPEALSALLDELRQDPDVEVAEPDYRMQAMATNDTYSSYQWALPKAHVPETWPVTQGGPLVAVIDTGVDYDHPDLAGQIVPGYDFVDGDADPMDAQGHGTHVAGIIAARANNTQGIAGVAPQSKILAIRVLGTDGGTASMVADGIRYAIKQGAKVINMSLGMPYDSFVVRDAVQQAVAAGVVVVAAAGNDNTSAKFYPAAYPGVIAVGATTSQDARASFSNYGDWLAIAAPGEGILSTVPGGYAYMSGTSMAAPHVSAAAAMVLARNPGWGASAVREALTTQADAVTGFEDAPAVRRLDTFKAVGPAETPSPMPSSPSPSPTPSPEPTPSPSPTLQPTKPEQATHGQSPGKADNPAAPGVSQAVRAAKETDDGRSVGARVSEAARQATKQADSPAAAPGASKAEAKKAPPAAAPSARRPAEAATKASGARGKSAD